MKIISEKKGAQIPFMTKKSAQKITWDLYLSHTQRPDLSNPRN